MFCPWCLRVPGLGAGFFRLEALEFAPHHRLDLQEREERAGWEAQRLAGDQGGGSRRRR